MTMSGTECGGGRTISGALRVFSEQERILMFLIESR
jgi:hypothetical protein